MSDVIATTSAHHPILVGLDGSGNSVAALRWAAAMATQNRSPLHVVFVREFSFPARALPDSLINYWPGDERPGARDATADSDSESARRFEDLVRAELSVREAAHLEVSLAYGDPATKLISLAEDLDASLIVLGRRGRGGFTRLLLGSVTDKCAAHAPCAVLAVSTDPGDVRDGVILVGVDASAESDAALTWAISQASAANSGLRIVGVWPSPVPPSTAQAAVDAAMRAVAASDPTLKVTGEVIQGDPSGILTELSMQAGVRVLVVGTRGREGFASLLLGSVAHQCLHHSTAAVAVVR